jgi:hypothetical protein
MVETIPENMRDAQRNEVALSTVLRYAVQIVTHVGATADRNFAITNAAISTTDDGASDLRFDLRNDGRRGALVRVRAELYDDQGTKRGQFDDTRGPIYPGASVRQLFALGRLPAGRYRMLLTLDAGEDALFATQFTFAK